MYVYRGEKSTFPSSISLGGMSWSDSGEYVVYAVSRSGSDWVTVYVRRSDRPHEKSAEDGGERGVDEGRLDEFVEIVLSFPRNDLADNEVKPEQRRPVRQVQQLHLAQGQFWILLPTLRRKSRAWQRHRRQGWH